MSEIVKDNCKHERFVSNAKVGRLFEEENPDVITEYRLDITVYCSQCYKPFSFIGLPGGHLKEQPTVSADTLTARMPIKPLL